jgi:CHAT domain-containing protein
MVGALGSEREKGKSCLRGGNRRFASHRPLAVVVGVALAAVWGCTPKPTGPTPMAPALSKFLRGGESYTAAVTCRPGEDVLARVTQDNIDVALELAGETTNTKVDFPSGRFGDEFLVFRCGPTGQHSIVIASVATPTPGGTIRMQSYSLGSAPASVIEAFRHMSNAGSRNVLRADNTWNDVLTELRSAAEIWKARSMQRELAMTEFAIGYVHYMDLTEWRAAVEHANEAAQLFASVGDEVSEAMSRQLQGAALEEAAAALTGTMDNPERQQMFATSESLLRNAEAQQRRLGRSFDAAMSHDYLAIKYYYQDHQDAATAALAEAQEEFSALGERSAQRMVLQNIATIYYENGSYAKAKQAFETLLPLMSMEDDPYLYATVLHNSALVLSVTGDVEKGLERELAALEIHRRRGSKAGESRSLYAIGIAYQRLGQYDRALEFLKNSLAIDKRSLANTSGGQSEETSQRLQILPTLIGIGNVERALGNFTRAAAVHSEARQYASSEKNQARVELALGLDYAAMDNSELARAHLELAERRATSDSNPYFVEVAVARGKALREAGTAAAGLPLLRQAARVASVNGNLREQAMVSMEVAASEAQCGDRRAALREIRRAVAISERLRMNASSPELRAETMAAQRDAYKLWVKLLLSNDPSPSGQGPSQRAVLQSLVIADRSHARGLVELLRHPQDPGTAAQPAADAEQQYDELAGKQATLDALLDRDHVDAQRISQLREEIAVLQTQVDLANRIPGSATPEVDALFTASSLDNLRRRMSSHCAVIEYLVSSDASWAWVLRHKNVALYRLPGEATIKTLVANIRRALQAPLADNDWAEASRALSDVVLRPAIAGRSADCLIIVPDGDLHYVPFAELAHALDPREDFLKAVSIAPSLEIISRGRAQSDAPEAKPKVVVFAPHAAVHGRPEAPPSLQSLKSEVGAIQGAFGTDNTYVANSNETTRSGFTRFDFKGYGIVHIATHGKVDLASSGMSRLIFGSGGDITDELRAYDISKMRFDAPLVVLSACETGKPIDGEGLLGLVHAFIGAGAQSVVMSLWKVPDDATARLMGAFYRALKGGRVSTERALAMAQLETKSSMRWNHPYYWSGFELFSTRLPTEAEHRKETRNE